MSKKILRIGTILFALVLVVSAFAGAGRALAAPGDLTQFNAADITAFRWDAMAKFYASHGVSTGYLSSLNAADSAAYRWSAPDRERLLSATSGVSTIDLTSFSAADISAYRWNAMAKFYASDLTSFSAADISAYRWNAMAKFYASQGMLTRNSSALNTSATTQQVNGERIYSWPGH